ncbi:hypothetical protein [Bacillus thuringiensis]|uniref:hypothetical protein n=1 Tax=Bacillus thuringiensis TaxID=1428 RepID=UPI0037F42CDF
MEKSPYYILVKNHYWKKITDYRLEPGQLYETTNKTGMTVTDQQTIKSTIGISIQSDAGINF